MRTWILLCLCSRVLHDSRFFLIWKENANTTYQKSDRCPDLHPLIPSCEDTSYFVDCESYTWKWVTTVGHLNILSAVHWQRIPSLPREYLTTNEYFRMLIPDILLLCESRRIGWCGMSHLYLRMSVSFVKYDWASNLTCQTSTSGKRKKVRSRLKDVREWLWCPSDRP